MKKALLTKIVLACIILTSGCGDDKVETTKKNDDIVVNTIHVQEIILQEETLVEETIKGW